MKLPLILPPDLDFCKKAQSENELFSLIADNLSKALEFLSYALDDEDWCDQHPEFLERVIRWLTELYYKDLLGLSAIERIRDIIHQNPQNIKKQLLRDITLQVDGKKHKVNSLLLAAVSPYFNRLLRQDEVKKKKTLHLSLESPEVSEVLIDIAE
ncbi:MAG: BTB/POZ domain-containing protein, partial [Chlamydiia bacterium]|nr:BTB/POZ domain-containing protein [Chlamydiia bacterium]